MKTTSIKVGARVYSVESTPAHILSESDCLGDCTFSLQRIRIISEGAPQYRAEIFVHELLHALVHDSHLTLPGIDEETLVRALSPRLAAFLADNPECVRELLRMLRPR